MKWGVRRYQNKDGSLTSQGKKRYYDTPELNKQKSQLQSAKAKRREAIDEYNKASNRYNSIPTAKNRELYEQANSKYRASDLAYRRSKLKYDANKEAARIQDKNIQFKNKTKHRLKLEEQYKKLGMTDEQAQAAANNRIRTEKILAVSAALTVGACITYIAVNNRKSKIDGIIKAGESLQRIEMRDTNGRLNSVFYASKGKHDDTRYANLLGMTRKQQTGHAYMMKLQANSDIKVASRDKAIKTFGDLYKTDSEFRSSVEKHVRRHFAGGNQVYDVNNLSNRNIKKMYDNFNANLPYMKTSGADQKFYSKLKSAGYGAIQDVNDMKYSGYNAKNPLIIFDNSKNNIMVKSVTEITGNLNRKGSIELMKATGESQVKQLLTTLGPVSAAALTSKTVSTYRSDPSEQYKRV